MKIRKAVKIATSLLGDVWIEIHYGKGCLSISGVEGPKRCGDARGGCGQINMHEWADYVPQPGIDLQQIRELWRRWHLNNMRPGCVHQRAAWDTGAQVEVVSYRLTTEARVARTGALKDAAMASVRGEPCPLDDTGRALVALERWFAPLYSAPDADSPLSGCYEVEKRETKTAGLVTIDEHPRGLLSRPCEVCGYKYGSAWQHEDVPADVVAYLESLPDDSAAFPWDLRA